jgi:hypothetical protein
MTAKTPHTKKEHKLEDEIKDVKNPIQGILFVLLHPKLLVPLTVVILLIIFAWSSNLGFKDGKFYFAKRPVHITSEAVDKTIERAANLKDAIGK